MFSQPETFLAADIRGRGTLRGSEWAWPVSEIPAIIEAVRLAGTVNVGGQLQFRLTNGVTCELYWIEVDTLKAIPSDVPWIDRVEQSAAIALSQFQDLQTRFDFLAEGQSAFGQHLDPLRVAGDDPLDAMCFVWYFEGPATV